jgi:hypothetical protein
MSPSFATQHSSVAYDLWRYAPSAQAMTMNGLSVAAAAQISQPAIRTSSGSGRVSTPLMVVAPAAVATLNGSASDDLDAAPGIEARGFAFPLLLDLLGSAAAPLSRCERRFHAAAAALTALGTVDLTGGAAPNISGAVTPSANATLTANNSVTFNGTSTQKAHTHKEEKKFVGAVVGSAAVAGGTNAALPADVFKLLCETSRPRLPRVLLQAVLRQQVSVRFGTNVCSTWGIEVWRRCPPPCIPVVGMREEW